MNFKKIIATFAAAALSVSALSVSALALSTKDYLKDGVTFHVTFEDNAEWYGGGIGANSNSTGWKVIEWGTNSKEITADVENNSITWLSETPIFAETDEYAQLWLQTWTGKVTVNSADVLGKGGTILSTDDAPAETEAPAEETEAAAEETEAAETEAAEEETEAPAETEAAEETEAPAETEAAPAAVITGDVLCDTEATSNGAWGQAITLTTIKNEGGVFDPACLTPDKAVVVYYEADTAPEVVLQSWSGGEGWAKVPADETLSSDGVAVFTYEYMTAMYQSEDFVTTLDAFIVGDTGSALTVSKVELVDLASLTGEAAEEVAEETPAETEAVVEETAPVADTTTPVASTGNTAVASIAAVMALAGAAALISKRK